MIDGMTFEIGSDGSSGLLYDTKAEFLEELNRMINECRENGVTYFSVM